MRPDEFASLNSEVRPEARKSWPVRLVRLPSGAAFRPPKNLPLRALFPFNHTRATGCDLTGNGTSPPEIVSPNIGLSAGLRFLRHRFISRSEFSDPSAFSCY